MLNVENYNYTLENACTIDMDAVGCLIRSATVQILPIHSLSNWVLNGSYYWAAYVRNPLPLPSISIYVSAGFACGKVVKHAVTFG